MNNIVDLQTEREYVWKYFALHAEQRLKTFHFFIIFSAILIGSIFNLLKDSSNILYTMPLGLLLSFFSFIFWKLDQRNKELIKHSENILKEIEAHTDLKNQNISLLFTSEKKILKTKKIFFLFLDRHYSYSDCFNLIFLLIGSSGIIYTIAIIFLPLTTSP